MRPLRSYNRLDHFEEVLGQFQGREGNEIPPNILQQIRCELLLFSKATASEVKKAMGKLYLTACIENFYYITREVEYKIVRMYKMIDRIWCSIERDNPRSFMKYCYILFKLLQLMGQTELLLQVPLLRNRLRLRQHDFLWKKVCDELGWTWKQKDIAYTNNSAKPRQGAYKSKPNGPIEI